MDDGPDMPADFTTRETDRLGKLGAYGILDTTSEASFDSITAITAHLCQTPMALVSLVDEQRQWFKAKVGIDLCSTSRDIAFCRYTILQAEPLIVFDATSDPRFADNPLVTGPPSIRFYAGAPLLTSDGFAMGSLCVLDIVPKELSAEQVSMLVSLAALVVDQLELRRTSLVLLEAARRARESEELIAQRSRQDRVLLNTLVEGVVVQDTNGRIIDCNAAATAILGLSVDELTGLTSVDTRWQAIDEAGHDLPGHLHPAMRVLRDGKPVRDFTFGVLKPDGQLTWLQVNCAAILDQNNQIERVVTGFADVTARKSAEEALTFQSLHDPLTDLANRTLLGDRLEHALLSSKRSGRPVGVLYVDLDGFKKINDQDGHAAGDEMLRQASERLINALRGGDTVARMGGDEFAVICPDTSGLAELRHTAERLLLLLHAPFELSVGVRVISASIGIALSDAASRPAELLAEADTAMYVAKNSGKNRVSTTG